MTDRTPYPIEELKRINSKRLKKIHAVCIRYGKTFSTDIRDEGSLFQIADEISRLADRKKDVSWIAATAIERTIKYHPFWDGNHRTAYELGRFICILFGFRLDVTLEDAVSFMRRIDSKDLSTKEIRAWIKKKAIPMKEL